MAWALGLVSIVWVAASAVPAVAREMGLTELRVVRRDFDRSSQVGHSGAAAAPDFEKDIGRSVDRLDPDGDDEGPFEIIVTARETTLRATPSSKAAVSGKLAPGVPLIVLSRTGVWVQVAHQAANDSLEVGWIHSGDVTSR